MKQLSPLLLLVLLVFQVSCEKDTVDYGLGEYFVDIATFQEVNSLLLDDGHTLFVSEGKISSSFQNGQRIWLNYSILPDAVSGYDYAIRVNGASAIGQGMLTGINAVSIDTMKNAPVQLESAWIGNHYLNLLFYIEYNSQTHRITLVTDSAKMKNDSVAIYLRHDTQNDPPGTTSRVIVSYDLEKVLGKPRKQKKLSVHLNTSNYGNKVYQFEY